MSSRRRPPSTPPPPIQPMSVASGSGSSGYTLYGPQHSQSPDPSSSSSDYLSQQDYHVRNEITVFHQDILDYTTSFPIPEAALERRCCDFVQRMEGLIHQQGVGEKTRDIYRLTLDNLEEMVLSSMDSNCNLEVSYGGLAESVKRTMDEDALSHSQPKAKRVKLSPTTNSKPLIQPKQAPIDFQKTQRKRRVEAGLPGQESLKYRPCRDFFMEHLSDPYPTQAQKTELMRRANITSNQLVQWFTNTRRRSTWMDIMKNYAKGRKEDMRVLVERALSPEGRSTVAPHIYDAILKMRKYVDELAREVVNDDFMQALNELSAMTEKDAKDWQDQIRRDRRRAGTVKRESYSPPPSWREESVAPRTGEKRKRTVSSEESISSTTQREPSCSVSPRASRAPLSSKTTLVLTDPEDEPHVPPKNLHRRRLGVADLTAPPIHIPLSAASTLVGSELGDTSPPMMTLASPLSLAPLPNTARLTSNTEDSQQVSVLVPNMEASVKPVELRTDNSTVHQLSPPGSARAPGGLSYWLGDVTQPVQVDVAASTRGLEPTSIPEDALKRLWDTFEDDWSSADSPSTPEVAHHHQRTPSESTAYAPSSAQPSYAPSVASSERSSVPSSAPPQSSQNWGHYSWLSQPVGQLPGHDYPVVSYPYDHSAESVSKDNHAQSAPQKTKLHVYHRQWDGRHVHYDDASSGLKDKCMPAPFPHAQPIYSGYAS